MAQVTVTINGRNYRMACHDGQEAHLKGLAEHFDANIQQLRTSFGEIGDQRLTVMAGVMALDEAHELKQQIKALKDELKAAQMAQRTLSAQQKKTQEQLAQSLHQAAGRIENMVKSIGQTE